MCGDRKNNQILISLRIRLQKGAAFAGRKRIFRAELFSPGTADGPPVTKFRKKFQKINFFFNLQTTRGIMCEDRKNNRIVISIRVRVQEFAAWGHHPVKTTPPPSYIIIYASPKVPSSPPTLAPHTNSASFGIFVLVTSTLQTCYIIHNARYIRYTRYIFLKYFLKTFKNM